MIKKLLILPLIGGIMSFGAFASANTITFNSSSEGYGYSPEDFTWDGGVIDLDITLGSSERQAFRIDGLDHQENEFYDTSEICCVELSNGDYVSCNGKPSCIGFDLVPGQYSSANNSDSSFAKVVMSVVSNGGSDDSSSIVPSIPSSFTSGITALVSNFGSILVGWLPTIILVALGITAIFALFRVVRNYARSSFNG